MRKVLSPFFISLCLLLTACNFAATSETVSEAGSSSSSSEDASSLVTHNVSYMGTIDELGVTTYMQGTNKLMLDDGRFLLIESTDVNLNLNTYLGKRVEVRGSLQPTVEAGGMLLRIEEVIVLDQSSSSSSSEVTRETKMCGGIAAIPCDDGERCVDDPKDSCDPENGGADCSGICVAVLEERSSSATASATTSSSSSSVQKVSSSASSSAVTSSSAASASASVNSAMEAQNVLLAKQVYNQDSLWTQKYCTSHIAFCVPVHKNWYYKSFGATTNNLWHVELGSSDIAELGQGAIILNLVAGTSASVAAQNGQIKDQGVDVIGYADWKDDTHFEIIADARLRAAVSYMLTHITPFADVQ